MSTQPMHFRGTRTEQGMGGFNQGAGRIDHIVYDNCDLAFDITDDVHGFGDIWENFPTIRDNKFRYYPKPEE